MIPSRGRNVGGVKQWKKRTYCCHGVCESNTVDSVEKMIPFPKPCALFYATLINSSAKHTPTSCEQCTKCLRWIHLCKRADNKLKCLTDINRHTYICSKHFKDPCGPTNEDPDPFPADKSQNAVDKAQKTLRVRCKRQPLEPAKRSKKCTNNDIDSAVTEVVQDQFVDHPTHEGAEIFQSDHPSFKDVAMKIFHSNLMVSYNEELIQVAISNDVSCVIDRQFTVGIKVFNTELPKSNNFWSNNPHSFDPKIFDYVGFLKSLKDQWSVCKLYKNTHLALKYQSTLDSEMAANIQINPLVNCSVLSQKNMCSTCKIVHNKIKKSLKRKKKTSTSKKKNIKLLSKDEAVQCVRDARRALLLEKRKSARLRRKVSTLIEKKGVTLSDQDSSDFLEILSTDEGHLTKTNSGKIDLTKLFFQEQIKAAKAKSPNGHRWHPLMLKWCLYLKTKSSSTYSALRKVITLPSEKRLYEIQAFTHVKPGFHEEVTEALVEEFKNAGDEPHKRYCAVVYDEMKIHEDLVYKTSTNELIGFVQLSSADQLLSDIAAELQNCPRNEESLATHVLQIMVRGVTSPIITPFAYFASKTLSAKNLYHILWEAVEILEGKKIGVVAFVSDGAAANRAFYNMSATTKDAHFTVNPYARWRNIYFVCDAPHLLKTTRNCCANSEAHKKSRLLWKNGKHILWRHIVEAYQRDLSDGFRKLIHISDEHIHLTPCSLMKVRLAAQVLSRRMGVALRDLESEEVDETVIFVELFNKWFDIVNVRNADEAQRTRNEDAAPFFSRDDPRLLWLTNDFIKYLDDWEADVNQRPGDFRTTDRAKMQLSRETIQGHKITARSVAALTRFLLDEGAPFVLTYKFNQDPVELEFSKQRGAGGCNTNPNLMRYGDNTAKLKSMKAAKKELAYSGKGNITRHKK